MDSCFANPLLPVAAFSHLSVPLVSRREAHLCSQMSATHHEADLAGERDEQHFCIAIPS